MNEIENDLITIQEAAKLVGKSIATIRAIFYQGKVTRQYKISFGKKIPIVNRTELLKVYPEKPYNEQDQSKEIEQKENDSWLEKKLRFFEENYQIALKQLEIKDTQISFLQNEIINAHSNDLSLKEMQRIVNMVKSQNMAKDEHISSLQRQYETSQSRLKVLEEISFKYAMNPGVLTKAQNEPNLETWSDHDGFNSEVVCGDRHTGYTIKKNDPTIIHRAENPIL